MNDVLIGDFISISMLVVNNPVCYEEYMCFVITILETYYCDKKYEINSFHCLYY